MKFILIGIGCVVYLVIGFIIAKKSWNWEIGGYDWSNMYCPREAESLRAIFFPLYLIKLFILWIAEKINDIV